MGEAKRYKPLTNIKIHHYILIVALVVILIIPDAIVFNNKTLCLHKTILGVECPLCGMTRATHELFHLKFNSAFQYNPIIFLFFIVIVSDLFFVFYNNQSLHILRKSAFILLLIGLFVLYFLRIAWYFNWF